MKYQFTSGEMLDDMAINRIWIQLHKERQLNRVFYDGSAANAKGLIKTVRDANTFFIRVEDMGGLLAIVWLNGWAGYTADIHFCGFKAVYGRSIDVGRAIHKVLFASKRDNDTEFVRTLIGRVPAFNRMGIKFMERMGYVILGIVPGAGYRAATAEHVDVVVGYCNKQILGD